MSKLLIKSNIENLKLGPLEKYKTQTGPRCQQKCFLLIHENA